MTPQELAEVVDLINTGVFPEGKIVEYRPILDAANARHDQGATHMTPPTSLPDFLADWQRREDEARSDDHEYAAWLVENAANIRECMKAMWNFSLEDTYGTLDDMNDAIDRLVKGK